jgi:hypothetical protein
LIQIKGFIRTSVSLLPSSRNESFPSSRIHPDRALGRDGVLIATYNLMTFSRAFFGSKYWECPKRCA